MSVEDGLVMQLHPGSLRDHNSRRRRAVRPRQGRRHPAAHRVHAQPARAAQRVRQRSALLASCCSRSTRPTYSRELAPLAGHYPARAARAAVVVPRFDRGHDALSPAGHRDGGDLQHRRLQRRHARLLLDPGAPRPRAPRGRELARRARRAPRRRHGRGARDGARARVRARARDVSTSVAAAERRPDAAHRARGARRAPRA